LFGSEVPQKVAVAQGNRDIGDLRGEGDGLALDAVVRGAAHVAIEELDGPFADVAHMLRVLHREG